MLHNASRGLDQSSSQKDSHECRGQSAVNDPSEEWEYSLPEHCHSQCTGNNSGGNLMHPILSWSDAWTVLGREAHTMLTGLQSANHIPWVFCCLAPCCAVLCCAVLCCAVLCCAVLCCAVYHALNELFSSGVCCCPLMCCAMGLYCEQYVCTQCWICHQRHPATEGTLSPVWAFVQVYLQECGSVLKEKVHRKFSARPRDCYLAPSDACRGYTIYAADTLLNWSRLPHLS